MSNENSIIPVTSSDLKKLSSENLVLSNIVKDALVLAKSEDDLDTPVVFECTRLEQQVRKALGNEEEGITRGQLLALDELCIFSKTTFFYEKKRYHQSCWS